MSDWLTRTPEQRFWEKVIKADGCWIWTATKNRDGYGAFWHNGRMRGAHRFSYEIHRGSVPNSLTIDHLCEVRSCVNPEHMVLATLRDNVLRSSNPPATNARKTQCPRGHEYNVVKSGVRKGERYCLACQRERKRLSLPLVSGAGA